jgi:hypothetical protein
MVSITLWGNTGKLLGGEIFSDKTWSEIATAVFSLNADDQLIPLVGTKNLLL